MIRIWQSIFPALPIALCVGVPSTVPTLAADTMPTITIEHPWARATAPGVPTGVAYLTIRNIAGEADRLTSVGSAAAKQVEIHQTTQDGDVMHMAPAASGLTVPAKGTVTLEPTGYHLMLIDLKGPLKAGEKVDLSLTFAKAGTIKVDAAIEATGASSPMDMKDSMPGMH